MRLQYSVLWVDDQKEKFEKLKYDQQIKEFIESLFFGAHLTFVETVTEAINAVRKRKFDVIFSDCNIGEDEKGDEFIKKIREYNVNTEVLFYSAQEEVKALNVDRISFFNIPERSGYQELLTRMKNLILLTIEKLQDLTNLRGLVMAEVSDLDSMMIDIILSGAYNEQNNKQYFYDHLISHCEKNIKDNLVKPSEEVCNSTCFHEWKNKNIIEIVKDRGFESSLKARAVGHLMGRGFYEDYCKEIIKVRNDLAHCKSELKDGKEVLHTLKGDDVMYDAESIAKIRQNITKYKKMFEKYLDAKYKHN